MGYLQFHPGENSEFKYYYRFAGQTFASDRKPSEIAAFRSAASLGQSVTRGYFPKNRNDDGDLIYQGKAWLCQQWRPVLCRVSSWGFRIYIDGVGDLSVTTDGRLVAFTRLEENVSDIDLLEAMLGPGLILRLALSGTWCLHASAILLNNCVIAFVGDSGFGKSTLVDFMAKNSCSSIRLVADDILPFRLEGERLVALPRFPQLKLPSDDQPGLALPETLPLYRVYVLAGPEATVSRCSIESLSVQSTATALIRQTISAKLFNKELLKQHFADCALMATAISCKRLTFPHSIDLLPQIAKKLQKDLGSTV